jgi:Na+-transporting NADH:ubiquinone oxidoreductase subunit NqrD
MALPLADGNCRDVMKKQIDQIRWTDVLYVPATLALSCVLAKWLSTALAVAVSTILALFVFSLFEPRESSYKRLILLIILIGIIVYALQEFLSWPT